MKCPFCPILLPNTPTMHNQTGPDFFGEPAEIGGILACADCEQALAMAQAEGAVIVAMLRDAAGNNIAQFFADFARVLCGRCGAYTPYRYEVGNGCLCPACYASLSAVRSQLAGA